MIGEGGPSMWDVNDDIEEELQEEGEVADINTAQQRTAKSEIGQRVEKFLTRAKKGDNIYCLHY